MEIMGSSTTWLEKAALTHGTRKSDDIAGTCERKHEWMIIFETIATTIIALAAEAGYEALEKRLN